jgi:type I pantothenate kinase
VELSLYETFSRAEWEKLRESTPLTLDADDIERLRGLNERLSLEEVEAVYLPLSRLLNLHVAAAQALHRVTDRFTGAYRTHTPYVIGMAGSVAVGKSTAARVLQAVLARWPDHPRVDLLTTDGFLYPNAVLDARGLMNRKGFPESYDVRRLLRFLAAVKAGAEEVAAPVYSHVTYDVVPDERTVIRQPDILIVEGVNVLQVGSGTPTFVSDYFDFSIYVDADVNHIRQWYIDRFRTLRETVFQRPDSYFNRYAHLSEEEADQTALEIWTEINERNLTENILSTRERAGLVLHKGADHLVTEVHLRRI